MPRNINFNYYQRSMATVQNKIKYIFTFWLKQGNNYIFYFRPLLYFEKEFD